MSILDALTGIPADGPAADWEYAEIDGTILDLRRDYADVTGVIWRWTGNRSGEPLMRSLAGDVPSTAMAVPLLDVYLRHGPLIPLPLRPTAAAYRAALTGDAQ